MTLRCSIKYFATLGGTVFALLVGDTAMAQNAAQKFSITAAVEHALNHDPAVHALRLKVIAQSNLSDAAKQLPDPTVRSGFANVPVDSFALNQEPMTQTLIGVRQTIPPIGSRLATSMNHDYLSQAFNHQTALRATNTTLATRVAWLEAHYQRHAVGLTEQAMDLLNSLAEVVSARYASGDELQLAVLAANLELSKLKSRLIDTKRHESQAVDELQRLLSVADQVEIGFDLPTWHAVPARETVRATLATHPRVQAADAAIGAEAAMTRFHATAQKPAWHIDLSYGVREGVDQVGDPRSDFASAMVSFSLPLVAKQKHSLRLAAAQAMEDSARQTKAKILIDMSADIAVAYSEWDRLSERLKLLDDTIVIQSRNHAQAALQAYQNKEGSFTDVLLSYVNEVDVKLEQHRVKIDRLKAWAKIDFLNGATK